VYEAKFISPLTRRTILNGDAVSALVPIVEGVVEGNGAQISFRSRSSWICAARPSSLFLGATYPIELCSLNV
jgi:hypothetical protein